MMTLEEVVRSRALSCRGVRPTDVDRVMSAPAYCLLTQLHEPRRDLIERQYLFHQAGGDGRAGHSEDHARLLVLGDDAAAALPGGAQPGDAVVAHPRQNDGDDGRTKGPPRGLKKKGSRRPEAANGRRGREATFSDLDTPRCRSSGAT